jgi:6-phosphogluconolactonase
LRSSLARDKTCQSVTKVAGIDGKPTGGLSAFQLDRTNGKLKFLQQVASLGTAPAHLSVDKTGHYVLVANYNRELLTITTLLETAQEDSMRVCNPSRFPALPR